MHRPSNYDVDPNFTRPRAAFLISRLPLALLAGGMLLLSTGCVVPQPRGEGKLARIVEPNSRRGYWLYLPKEYVAAQGSGALRERSWPTVVSFHGMKPFDNALPQAEELEQEADRYGFVVVAPELRSPDMFAEFPLQHVTSLVKGDEEATLKILDHVFQTTAADPNHVLATSWSSGGYMAHYMMNRHPDRFSCLAVRQSNFSGAVLDESMVPRELYHPILIVNTENDFAICKQESKEAVRWYEDRGFKNVYWVIVRGLGHERTPDVAAYFFARVTDTPATTPAKVLARRQAIDGNAAGLEFLAGGSKLVEAPAGYASRSGATNGRSSAKNRRTPRDEREARLLREASNQRAASAAAKRQPTARPVKRRGRPSQTASPLGIRVSSAVGIEPLHLGYSAECPADWYGSSDFLWSLDGEAISSGVNGQKTLAAPGEHELSLLVITDDGIEHRATRHIRVLPRLDGDRQASNTPVSAGAGG